MNLEQYTGCLIRYKGRIAIVTGARSNYDGDVFYLQYTDSDTSFTVDAFEKAMIGALPDPGCGLLKRMGDEVVFLYDETEYTLGSHPYEPCLYIKKDGGIVRTLHNAFTADELPERFAEDGVLTGIDGKEYDLESFCRVLAAAITSDRTEMDFPFAAGLSQK